jgi:hypothetical protein
MDEVVVMCQRMLSGKGEVCRPDTSGLEDNAGFMEALQSIFKLSKTCCSVEIVPGKITEVQKGVKSMDHLSRDMSFDSRQIDLEE